MRTYVEFAMLCFLQRGMSLLFRTVAGATAATATELKIDDCFNCAHTINHSVAAAVGRADVTPARRGPPLSTNPGLGVRSEYSFRASRPNDDGMVNGERLSD